MKRFLLLLFYIAGVCSLFAQATKDSIEHEVLLETSMGNIKIALFNDTPLHRDNFLRLVREGYYDGLLFHRIIPDFMIQAGDSASRHAVEGQHLGDSPESYTISAEITFPTHFHRTGALAAAREDDAVNPQHASSAYQFYIVTGRPFTDSQLDRLQTLLDSTTAGKIKYTPEIRNVYEAEGGAPHLDGTYTVFGQVIEGLETIYRIQWVSRDEYNRPFDDVRIVRATVIR